MASLSTSHLSVVANDLALSREPRWNPSAIQISTMYPVCTSRGYVEFGVDDPDLL